MFYYTHHSNMDAPQYVHVDVPAGYFFDRMFYYTHHSDMDAPQYVHVDVPVGNFFDRMFYYTRHSNMDAPRMYTLMYLQSTHFPECSITHITAICTFHSMCPLLLFHSALLSKCSTESSLLQRKKEAILPF